MILLVPNVSLDMLQPELVELYTILTAYENRIQSNQHLAGFSIVVLLACFTLKQHITGIAHLKAHFRPKLTELERMFIYSLPLF